MGTCKRIKGKSVSKWFFFLHMLIILTGAAGSSQKVQQRRGRYWGKRKGGWVMEEVVHLRRRGLQTTMYCVANSGADQAQLQVALDWACGPGNANCAPIQQGGECYDPDTLVAHASYAFNSYYVTHSGVTGSCFFNGVATLSSTNPSSGSCIYPSLSGTTTTTPTTPTTPSTTPTTTTPTTTTPTPTTTTPTTPTTTDSPYFDTNTTFSPPTTGTTSSAINISLPWIPYGLCGLLIGMILLS